MNGHNHNHPARLTAGCPACAPAIDARNLAIGHLSEALELLAGLQNPDDPKTIHLGLYPKHLTDPDTVNLCHGWEITPKLAESIADAVDSVNAYVGSEQLPTVDALLAVNREAIESGEWSAASVAHKYPALYADVTDLFLLVDPQDYLDDVFAGQDPHASMNAYEELVTGEWDGGEA